MTESKLQAVLFDLDGVLLDTEGVYTEYWRGVDEKYPTGVENFAYVIKGNTLERILMTYFPDEEVQANIVRDLKRHEREMQYRPYAWVRDKLSDLKSAQVRTAIVTSSNKAKMDNVFKQLPWLEQMIDVLITDADVKHSKPHPEGYLLAAERLGCEPGSCVVVEDSLSGLEAGLRAGSRVLALATTNGQEVLRERGAHVVLDPEITAPSAATFKAML